MKLFLLNVSCAFYLSCASEEYASPRFAPLPVCKTRCGMKAPGKCAELQRLEDEFVLLMVDPLKVEATAMCEALGQWTVYIHPYRPSDRVVCPDGNAWPLPISGMCAVGYTHDTARNIEVTDLEWRQNALPHELVHAVEISVFDHAGHCAWQYRGIKGALHALTGEADWTPSVCP